TNHLSSKLPSWSRLVIYSRIVNKYAECNVKQLGDVEWPVKNTDMVEIRTAQPGDSAAIQEVHTLAFGGPVEARLVKLICERQKALISLVAVRDGTVVAHVLFSQVTVATVPEGFKAVGLAPVAVVPQFHKQGIGSKLIHEGLERCKHTGYDAVFLIG